MPTPITKNLSRTQREAIANAGGLTLDEVNDAFDIGKKTRQYTRVYDYNAQRKLLDKMLAHMEDSFLGSGDSMSLQQFTNSIVQVLRMRLEIENLAATPSSAGDADPMDAEGEKVTHKLMQFGAGR